MACLGLDLFSTPRRRRFAGVERGSRFLQFARSPFCERVRATKHAPRDPFRVLERRHGLAEIVKRGAGVEVERSRITEPVSSAHFSTATATASLYFLSALYCSALPPRCIFLHICLWPRRQWSCWQVALQ